MSEFNDRIAAQRRILKIVNCSLKLQEELFGLSSGALERWIASNHIDSGNPLALLLRAAASKLFFLSNKSQEQITEDYVNLSAEVDYLSERIREVCSRIAHLRQVP